MQSVYKAPIAMAVLYMADEGKLKLDQQYEVKKSDMITERQHSPIRDTHPRGTTMSVRDLLRYAVSESDGTASDVLLRLVGGPMAVTAFLDSIRVNEMIVETTEMEMGKTTPAIRGWHSSGQRPALDRPWKPGARRDGLDDLRAEVSWHLPR